MAQKAPSPAVAHATHRSSGGIAGTSNTQISVVTQKNAALRLSALRADPDRRFAPASIISPA
jgi:hypothetical protein